jgi:hypothetical protein
MHRRDKRAFLVWCVEWFNNGRSRQTHAAIPQCPRGRIKRLRDRRFLGWLFGCGKSRGRTCASALRRGMPLAFEPLELRQMLSVVPPVLAANVNTIVPSQAVTLSASMPAAATGTVDFMDGATELGSEALSAPDSQAISLDGSSGDVSLPTSLKFTSGASTGFTISEWFYPTEDDAFQFLFMRGFAYGDQEGDIGLKINASSNKLDFQAKTADGSWLFGWDAPESALSASFNLNQWNHVVVTCNSSTGTYSMWMNGQLVSMATSTESISDAEDTNPIYIGAMDTSSGPTNFFQGSISELDIWNAPLTTSQVATLNNGGTIFASNTLSDYPDYSALVAGYHLSGNANDFVGSNNGTPSSSGVSYPTNSATGAMATITATLSNVGNSITANYLGDDDFAASTSAAKSVVEEATTLSGISSEITNQPPRLL